MGACFTFVLIAVAATIAFDFPSGGLLPCLMPVSLNMFDRWYPDMIWHVCCGMFGHVCFCQVVYWHVLARLFSDMFVSCFRKHLWQVLYWCMLFTQPLKPPSKSVAWFIFHEVRKESIGWEWFIGRGWVNCAKLCILGQHDLNKLLALRCWAINPWTQFHCTV